MDKKDRVEIMFEKMQGDMQLLLEGYSNLVNRMGSLEENMGRLEEKMGSLEENMNRQFGGINTAIKILTYEVKETNANLDKHIGMPTHLAHAAV